MTVDGAADFAKMMSRFRRWALLTAVIMLVAAAVGKAAVPNEPVEPATTDSGFGAIRIDNGQPTTVSRAPSGNPLWAIPLKELSATRERPIFSPSRRELTPAAVTGPYVPPPQSAKPPEPDRPQLSLVGTVAGHKRGFGIFLDRTANTVLRLKTGEAHEGWILREVRSRETVLEKGDKTTTLSLPPPATAVREDEDEKDLKRSSR